MKSKAVKLPTVTCKRCRHTWVPRVPSPKWCPSCNSPYWNQPRQKDVAKKKQDKSPAS